MMDTSRAWFVYAGKIKVRYLLNSPRTFQLVGYALLDIIQSTKMSPFQVVFKSGE